VSELSLLTSLAAITGNSPGKIIKIGKKYFHLFSRQDLLSKMSVDTRSAIKSEITLILR
jgi:hypothetical protein